MPPRAFGCGGPPPRHCSGAIVDEPQRAALETYCPVFAVAAPALVVHAVLGDRVATRRRRAWLAVLTAASNVGLNCYLYATSGVRASVWPIVATTYAHALGLSALSWSLESRQTADKDTKNRPTQALATIVPWLSAVVLAVTPAPALGTSLLVYVGLGLEFGAGVARNYGCHRVGITTISSGLVALAVVYGVPWATAVSSTAVDKVVVVAFGLASLATVVGPPASPTSTVGGAVVFLLARPF
ncbi:hypothetical protein SPRG_02463 [Saprolegnia parasitica CBS 223.65]|uniref:Uncharacterized protein n=1 Tax=Saprolegnia parasitica (strain CBS 223.65) TaxID=695850 RepID=A0A067CU42_SAPPC|nr:hypothetical protein SPRG_02463 [Saprolegnia parasitica CBS 223.65]KDO32765.1 hypothetical protein SPRG_02463 [Saprolegnia parasitica CBS 223.65]|eukprot:XP_012196429.1 hypothetical protein SPRG_02463 [Saprolegnia parasitica CBS 223.65]